jgi:hypothetical protein
MRLEAGDGKVVSDPRSKVGCSDGAPMEPVIRLERIRNREMGFIFRSFNRIGERTVRADG